MAQTIMDIVERSPVIPVLVIEDIADAKPLAKALFDSGLGVLEVTLRSKVAFEAALEMKQAVPNAFVGVGTITSPISFEKVALSELDFGVSPGTPSNLLQILRQTEFPFLPGAATLSEIMDLYDAGFKTLKFFPAEASGGTAFLKSVLSVMPDISFCPTGGIHLDNAASYLGLDNVKVVGGSWIAPTDLIRQKNWSEIAKRAQQASRLVKL